MKKFEYKITRYLISSDLSILNRMQYLNLEGQNGWKLIHIEIVKYFIDARTNGCYTESYEYVWEREL